MASRSGAAATATTERPKELASDLCWLLTRASDTQEQEFEARAMAASGLTARKHHVLIAASERQYTQNELARVIGLDTTTMVGTLDELEEAGLAERLVSPTDRRARIVKVTPAGRRAVRKCNTALAEAQEQILGRLPAGQREVFLDSLRRLAFPDDAGTPAES